MSVCIPCHLIYTAFQTEILTKSPPYTCSYTSDLDEPQEETTQRIEF